MARRESKPRGEAAKALSRYKKFWGLKAPVKVHRIQGPATKKNGYLVGMGNCPVVVLANAKKKGRGVTIRKIRESRVAATDPSGRRIFLLSRGGKSKLGRAAKGKLKFIGWVPETHYIPTRGMERAGTFKKHAHWTHEHNDKGGRWPKAFVDDRGNVIYGRGTYRITDWIRK